MAEIILELECDTMDIEKEVDNENFNQKDDAHSELSDDSVIEILTHDNVEENTLISNENNLENTEEESQNYYIESLETNNEIEIINLSSDDEGTHNSEGNILENRSETIDCSSEDSDSSDEQVAIEIETENEKININRNSHLNLDELFLGSDEEFVMFDFSNYSADDVLRAVENNKLLIKESGTQNVNSEKTEDDIECNIEIEESKISSTDVKTRLNINYQGCNNKNTNNKPYITKLKMDSANSVKSTCDITESADYKKNNDVISETILALKCRKCGTLGSTKINSNIAFGNKRRCPNCTVNLSFQCKKCTVLFHSILSFSNHLKNYHMKENEEILQNIDNLNLKYNGKKRIRNRRKVSKVQKVEKTVKKVKGVKGVKKVKKVRKVQKVQTIRKVQKVQAVKKNKVLSKCVNCAKTFLSVESCQIHKLNCQAIPYLYCRFCPLNTTSVTVLREHMTLIHSLKINQSDLNQILNGIEQEARKLIDIKSTLLVTCLSCKYIEQLRRRERHCYSCKSSLMFKCGRPNCELMFPRLGELFSHVRQQHLHTWHRCDMCGAAFTECGDAARHRHVQHPECRVSYRHCQDCHYEASSPGDMSSHVHSAHTGRRTMLAAPYQGPYICKACGKVFKLEHRLRKHESSFCRKMCRTYGCAHCRYTSVDKRKLLMHLRCNHVYLFTGKKLRCHRCGLELDSIYTLNNHMGKCKTKRGF